MEENRKISQSRSERQQETCSSPTGAQPGRRSTTADKAGVRRQGQGQTTPAGRYQDQRKKKSDPAGSVPALCGARAVETLVAVHVCTTTLAAGPNMTQHDHSSTTPTLDPKRTLGTRILYPGKEPSDDNFLCTLTTGFSSHPRFPCLHL